MASLVFDRALPGPLTRSSTYSPFDNSTTSIQVPFDLNTGFLYLIAYAVAAIFSATLYWCMGLPRPAWLVAILRLSPLHSIKARFLASGSDISLPFYSQSISQTISLGSPEAAHTIPTLSAATDTTTIQSLPCVGDALASTYESTESGRTSLSLMATCNPYDQSSLCTENKPISNHERRNLALTMSSHSLTVWDAGIQAGDSSSITDPAVPDSPM